MNGLEVIRDFPKDFIFGTATSSYQIKCSTHGGFGRELFSVLRSNANCAEMGGGINSLETTYGNE